MLNDVVEKGLLPQDPGTYKTRSCSSVIDREDGSLLSTGYEAASNLKITVFFCSLKTEE
jgi:hypothetical protein